MASRRFWSNDESLGAFGIGAFERFLVFDDPLDLDAVRVALARPAAPTAAAPTAAAPQAAAAATAANPAQDNASPQADLDQPTGPLLFGPIKSSDNSAAAIRPEGPFGSGSTSGDLGGRFGADFGGLGSQAYMVMDGNGHFGYHSDGYYFREPPPLDTPAI